MYNYIYNDGITKYTAYQYHKDRICNNIYANNYISTLKISLQRIRQENWFIEIKVYWTSTITLIHVNSCDMVKTVYTSAMITGILGPLVKWTFLKVIVYADMLDSS